MTTLGPLIVGWGVIKWGVGKIWEKIEISFLNNAHMEYIYYCLK